MKLFLVICVVGLICCGVNSLIKAQREIENNFRRNYNDTVNYLLTGEKPTTEQESIMNELMKELETLEPPSK